MKLKKKMRYWYLGFLILFSLFSFIDFCRAATLYLEPNSGEFSLGETFSVSVFIDTEGEIINVANVNLDYPEEILAAKDFSQGNSILNLWIKNPEIKRGIGKISFAGGIPGGFKGNRGFLGKVFFESINSGEGSVFFEESSEVLLNDGFGTKANLKKEKAKFSVLTEKLEIPEDQLKKEIEKDKIPPESFKIEINQYPSIFEGKHFITFNTTDKQSGVDHYEVKEGKRNWEKAESPYLLKNQSLGEKIQVKAVDKAGNERIEEITPEPVKRAKIDWRLIVKIVLIIIGLGVVYLIYRKIVKKKIK
jgi:hypothetical protein